MQYSVKNWKRFQHFKDRRPLWIKLYREILDSRDINRISDGAFRVLVCCWLLASEDVTKRGLLPSIEDMAFRLRIEELKLISALEELKDFIFCVDINPISNGYQDDALEERRGEKRKRREEESREEALPVSQATVSGSPKSELNDPDLAATFTRLSMSLGMPEMAIDYTERMEELNRQKLVITGGVS